MKAFRTALNVALAGALLTSPAAFAGYQFNQEVSISDSGGSYPGAGGNLGFVRNTADQTQYLGCYTASGAGLCFATDSAGRSRACHTGNANMLETMRLLADDSYLIFYWDTSNNCAMITVHTDSSTQKK